MALSHLTLLVEQTLLAAPNAAISAWHAKLREADRALSFISSSFVSFNLKEDHFFTKIFCLISQMFDKCQKYGKRNNSVLLN
ncbi:hypothetical protein BpHYR1_011635 [Brachionus plicatilis]|uniref:Uncharacterized protein n=1 Tax=Brachionus plicatilis TaxID=10195 RepID=A0A3M7QMI7_BRAPC|nr:hypothetical protein BpHYR1_011635 [Brachionus plicatilis]